MDIKKQIILCMEDLDQLPETSFEKDIVCEDEDTFCLSRENIASLKLLLFQVSPLVYSHGLIIFAYHSFYAVEITALPLS